MLDEARLTLLKQMAHGLAAEFGPSCEVVIHDLTVEDLEHTVVHIENGQVTGRSLGGGPSHAENSTPVPPSKPSFSAPS